MADIKNIKLTKDHLKNIKIMIPLLNDRECEAVSYFMYGCCVGGAIEEEKQKARFQENS